MRTHSVFGVTLASDFEFKNRLRAGTPPAELHFGRIPEALTTTEGLEPVYSSHSENRPGESSCYFFRLGEMDLLRFTRVADYYVGDRRIDVHLRDPAYEHMVEIQFLGSIFSFWLERLGIPALHGSAVAVNGHAIAFLSSNRGGKTALAAAMMQRGYPLLTDDILPVEQRGGDFHGRSAYPQMRMWPDEAAHFLGRWQDLEIVHPAYSKRRVAVGGEGLGSFCGVSRPLACLYLPRRRRAAESSESVEIRPLAPRDAVIELVRHSFSPYIVEAAGWQVRRFDFFARLAARVPMRLISYPTGFHHLPAVCDEISKDLEPSGL